MLWVLLFMKATLGFWGHGHMLIAKIARNKLKSNPKVILQVEQILQPLSEFFRENDELMVQCAIGPDSIMD